MTPIGLLVFASILLLLVFGSLYMDGALSLPRLLPGFLGSAIGGSYLWQAWCFGLGAWFGS